MRNSIVRTLQLALVVLLTLALVACGSSKGSSGTSTSGDVETAIDSSEENKTCLACHASQTALDTKLGVVAVSDEQRTEIADLRAELTAIEWEDFTDYPALEELSAGELAAHAIVLEEELEPLAELAATEDRANGLLVEEDVMGTHGKLACVECHKSSDEVINDWHQAIMTNPTADGGDVCASCHGTKMVENYKASIHFTLSGIAKGLCDRLKPLSDQDELDGTNLAQEAFDSYFPDPENGCMACHATCGSCHVSSPLMQDSDAGGLMENHRFMPKPESELSCMKCHWENGEGWEAMDVHATAAGMECTSCHTAIEEVHGRDTADMDVDSLFYKGPATEETGPVEPSLSTVLQTSCSDCHETPHAGLTAAATIANHTDKLDCFACHTQPYYNCVGCHADSGEPSELVEYLKLGLTVKGVEDSKLGLLTHIGSAVDMIEGFNIIDPELNPNPNTNPDWKSGWAASSAMHLIARKPLVNDDAIASGSMCLNCHSTTYGKTTFLTEAEVESTAGLPPEDGGTPIDDRNWAVPDERLPSTYWGPVAE